MVQAVKDKLPEAPWTEVRELITALRETTTALKAQQLGLVLPKVPLQSPRADVINILASVGMPVSGLIPLDMGVATGGAPRRCRITPKPGAAISGLALPSPCISEGRSIPLSSLPIPATRLPSRSCPVVSWSTKGCPTSSPTPTCPSLWMFLCRRGQAKQPFGLWELRPLHLPSWLRSAAWFLHRTQAREWRSQSPVSSRVMLIPCPHLPYRRDMLSWYKVIPRTQACVMCPSIRYRSWIPRRAGLWWPGKT